MSKQVGYDSKEVKRKQAPTMFIELVDQRDSGWVQDGTLGTKHEKRLTAPSAQFISNRGYRRVEIKNEKGEVEVQHEAIRYIKNCPVLSVEEQNRRGFKPAKNKMEDLILVRNGNMTVTREGAFKPLYDYLTEVFYNASNPNRPSSAKARFRVVEIGKIEEELNVTEMVIADAMNFIGTLFSKEKDGFKYDQPKIDTLCNVFQVFAESPAGKINGLIAHSKKNPEGFLNKALQMEQTVQSEVAYAVELGIIKFDGNTAMYCDKDKIIADLGRGNISLEKKKTKLADLFGTDEYKAAYEEFQIELGAAQEKSN